MTQYIQGRDGKFAGSIGDGKTDVPSMSDIPKPVAPNPDAASDQPDINDVYSAFTTALPADEKHPAITALEEAAAVGRFKEAWESVPTGYLPTSTVRYYTDELTGEAIPITAVDLTGIDLHEADLTRVDFRGAILRKANLSKANLSGANLSRTDLSGASLRWAKLDQTTISDANLSGADLVGTTGERVSFRGSNLSGATFGGSADLKFSDFRNTICSGTMFSYDQYSNATLTGSNFNGAHLGTAVITRELADTLNGTPRWDLG